MLSAAKSKPFQEVPPAARFSCLSLTACLLKLGRMENGSYGGVAGHATHAAADEHRNFDGSACKSS